MSSDSGPGSRSAGDTALLLGDILVQISHFASGMNPDKVNNMYPAFPAGTTLIFTFCYILASL